MISDSWWFRALGGFLILFYASSIGYFVYMHDYRHALFVAGIVAISVAAGVLGSKL